MITQEYIEKIEGSVLGKVIGVRLGVPYEFSKTSAEIQAELPYVQTYSQEGHVTYPDDDTTGFVIFAKCFEKINSLGELTPEIVGDIILNYASENRGFFWWGEKGTERNAYHQLLQGVSPQVSGDYEHVGELCNCIGGQIFYDAIGIIFAGHPEKAVKASGIVSRVLHNGEGAIGGQFISGCISIAFLEDNIENVVKTALSLIPPESRYAKMVNDIIQVYYQNPYDWHFCQHYIDTHYNWHNVWDYGAHVVMSLLYGKGSFGSSMQICLHSAGDTDCNCANVGAILGAFCGYKGISYQNWIEPLYDRFYISSAVPYENDVSISRFTAKLIALHCKFSGKAVPDYIQQAKKENIIAFPFSHSTQGMEVIMWRNGYERYDLVNTQNSLQLSQDVVPPSGSPYTLKFWAHYVKANDCMRIYRWFDGEKDFGDYRVYEPTSCTRIFGGQIIRTKLYTRYNSCNIHIRFVVYCSMNRKEYYSDEIMLKPYEWTELSFTLPDIGTHYDCLNIQIVPENDSYFENGYDGLDLYVDTIEILGKPDYKIDFYYNQYATSQIYHYPVMKNFNICYGEAKWLPEGCVHFYAGYKHCYQSTTEKNGYVMAVTGSYMENYIAKCKMSVLPEGDTSYIDKYHSSAFMLVAVNGVTYHYAVGFHNGTIAILKSGSLPSEYTILVSSDYDYNPSKKYYFRATVAEKEILFTVMDENQSNQKTVQVWTQEPLSGCIGFGSIASGIMIYSYHVK